MKLVRYGEPGQETPGLIDSDGLLRDLTGHIDDITGATLGDETLEKLRGIDVDSLQDNPRQSAHRPVRRQYRQVHVHRPELFRPRRRIRPAGSQAPGPVHEGDLCRGRPERHGLDAARLDLDGLGGRTGRRDRHQGQICQRGGRAEPCRGLLRDQRCVGTAFPEQPVGQLDQGQIAATPSAPPAPGWSPATRFPTRKASTCGWT